ncbi:trypsin-like serine protease [Tenacibaculum finnmarkense genomovar ulcerans]|uniref:trypsin-like serine protease n=1 Tax=Tenacibaculum finnmarkense TaxID=2781243 RepID=UPI00187B2F96|nr:trypsin-like serine protease [Tenacibaculum finnmarkense]MBE7645183.1 trypsin-like serine protease [Tenacibaculum finnmarkense genomovar ulcerans]MCG8784953.1 trypsin-like peptidase domain-containing protein [Tenacibaculum finnmarkense]
MITDILEKSCVRITIKKEGENINQGSGVIIVNDNNYYVLTAFHCLGDSLPNINDIYIETQEDYKSEFKKINIVSIKSSDDIKDWVLIKIDFHDEENLLQKINLGKGFINKEQVVFYGYQGILNTQFRFFNGEINLVTTNKQEFVIKLKNDSFSQGDLDGNEVAQGLSGSGVFIEKNEKLFLIGILNSVNTERALHDDINCCSVVNLSGIIGQIDNMSDIDFLKQWEENLENKKTIKDLENYRLLNNKYFKYLERKNKVIYDTEEIANKNTQKQLLKYLSLQENIDQLSFNNPHLHNKFINIVKKFQDAVEDDYSKSVINNNEAKNTKIDLKNHLKYELEKVIPNDIEIDLADFQVIKWLLDCSLNFTNR